MQVDRRSGDYKLPGKWNSFKRFCSNKLLQAVVTALLIAFILFTINTLASMQTRYAARGEIKLLEDKHFADIQRLDSIKLDKKEYEANHEYLRREIKENLADLKNDSKEQRTLLMQILTNQKRQHALRIEQ